MVGNNHCFVPGCQTGYPSDRKECKLKGKRINSLFVPPQDAEIMEKWKRAIPRADKVLTRNDKVCMLHFKDDEIERFYITKLADGSEHRLERTVPRVKQGSIPSIFPNLPAYLSKPSKKRKSPACRVDLKKPNVKDQVTDDTSVDNHSVAQENLMFNVLLEKLCHIKLPSKWWTITSVENYIICVKWNNEYFPERRIIIEKNLTIKVFVNYVQVNVEDLNVIASPEDLCLLIQKVDCLTLCAGNINKYLTNCRGHVQNKTEVRRKFSSYCNNCKLSRRNKKDVARRHSRKNGFSCNKRIQQRLACANRKRLRLASKVTLLQQEIAQNRTKCAATEFVAISNLISELPEPQQEAIKACIHKSVKVG